MEWTLDTIARHLNGRVIGDGSIPIRGVNSLDAVGHGELTFVDSDKRLAQAMASSAAAVIVPWAVQDLGGRAGISVHQPKLAFALVLALFHPAPEATGGIHPSAVLGDGVQCGSRVHIRANAVIGNEVCIGNRTVIESGVHLGDGVTIGDGCLIGPNVVVYRQTHIGHRVRIHGGTVIGGDGFGYIFHDGQHVKVPQVGNVVIEDDVEIGCNVCIDRATIGSTLIRRGAKIDNLVQIGHNNRIGEHVIITGQGGLSGSVTVGNYAVLGGRTGVTDHVTIGEGAQVGLCSVVTKSVPPGSVVWGYPARPINAEKHRLAALARLPAVLKNLTRLIARLGGLEERLAQVEHGLAGTALGARPRQGQPPPAGT